MATDQTLLFGLLITLFALLIWGRWRYDLLAFLALIAALLLGLVPKEDAFSGFGHPATIIVALVLIVSRGLSSSGAIEIVARQVAKLSHSLQLHIAAMSGISALLSAIMNNVATLAMLMPVDLQAAARAKRSPALTLMPLSFATILGGMITLIGTPPNIVIAEFREKTLGEGFSMFDFTPVGLACAVAGVLFVATIGWRLIPVERMKQNISQELIDISGYLTELHVPEGSKAIGQRPRDLDDIADEHDVLIAGLIRNGLRMPGRARWTTIQAGDILVIESGPETLDSFAGAMGLDFRTNQSETPSLTDEVFGLLEVVVPKGARIEGRSTFTMQLQYRHDTTLIGVSRQGRQFRDRVKKLPIQAGDVLLLFGPSKRLNEVSLWLGTLPLAERGLELVQRQKAWLATAIFAAAILLSSLGILYLPVALATVVALYTMLRIVPPRQVYESVEWPVIVLLGSLIPIGVALETSGATAQIAGWITMLSAGHSPVVVLTLLMIVTIALSSVMNNTATAVIAAPVAVDIASRLMVNPDPFLMAVAVASSCAFLTPIGHKNNTLIMGPGGYRFGDYWRMGLPLELLVMLVSIPTILWVWPL